MKPRTIAFSAAWVAVLAAIAITAVSCNLFGEDPKTNTGTLDPGTKPPIDAADAVSGKGKAVLAKLGVPTELGGRPNADGTLMQDTDNPFGKRLIAAKVINEIFTISKDNKVKLLNIPGVYAGTATDLVVSSDSLQGTSGQIKRPVAADIDGDGKQEIVMANFNPSAKTIAFFTIDNGTSYTIQNAGSTITWKTTRSWPDIRDYYSYQTTWPFSDSSLNGTRDWNHMIDVASGDIDADGKDEIVIASEATLYVLDDDLSLKMQKDFLPIVGSNSNNQILRVEIGDLNDDGKAEVAVSNGTMDTLKTAEIYVYGYELAGSLTSLLSGVRSASAASTNLRTAEIAIGDVDGDKQPEVVLAGLRDNAGMCVTMVMKVQMTSGVWTDSFLNIVKESPLKSQVHNYWSGAWWSAQEYDAMVPILAVGDLDGNGTDEIVANDDVLAVTVASGNYSIGFAFSNGETILRKDLVGAYLPGWGGIWGDFVNGSVDAANDRYPDTAYYNQVKVGDLNGDGKEEIVVLDYQRARLRTYSYGNGLINKNSDIVLTTDDVNSSNFCKYLCLADVNNDGAQYKYNGHALMFSAPVIMGVISGPPYWNVEDPKNPGVLIQDTSNMATSFGITTGASVGIGGSVEVAVSGKVGVGGVLPVAANGEAKATVEITGGFAASFDATLSGSIEVSYSCPSGVDKVMFFSVPIDVWEYENVNNPADIFYIKEPRRAEMQYVDVDWYNAYNGDYPDIDAVALKSHTIGNPYSYPRLADATSLFDALPGASFLIKKLQEGSSMIVPGVPQGAGYTSLVYTVGGSVGSSFSIFGEVKYEQECSFIGLVGASASVKIEGHVSTELNAETSIGGAVGGLVSDFYTTGYKYDWGIFVYPHSLDAPISSELAVTDQYMATSNNFLVLNYWVEPK